MFSADVKKYDPDETLDSEQAFDTISEAINWTEQQKQFGFRAGWVGDGVVNKRVEEISVEEIRANHLQPKYNPNQVEAFKRDAKFRSLYQQLAEEYCRENQLLLEIIAPLIGLQPYMGAYNSDQVIWAKDQEQANSLSAGENIFKFVKQQLWGRS